MLFTAEVDTGFCSNRASFVLMDPSVRWDDGLGDDDMKDDEFKIGDT